MRRSPSSSGCRIYQHSQSANNAKSPSFSPSKTKKQSRQYRPLALSLVRHAIGMGTAATNGPVPHARSHHRRSKSATPPDNDDFTHGGGGAAASSDHWGRFGTSPFATMTPGRSPTAGERRRSQMAQALARLAKWLLPLRMVPPVGHRPPHVRNVTTTLIPRAQIQNTEWATTMNLRNRIHMIQMLQKVAKYGHKCVNCCTENAEIF